jgi:hypothetical protein
MVKRKTHYLFSFSFKLQQQNYLQHVAV